MKKKIAVIGANGYLGKHMVKYLLEKGESVDGFARGESHIFKDDSKYNHYTLDITEAAQVSALSMDYSTLFMMAGATGTLQSVEDYSRFIDVNEKSLLHILTSLKNSDSKARLIFPSTRLVYQGVANTPLKEDSALEHKTIYSINKYACEQYLKIFNTLYDIPYCAARICVPYGNQFDLALSYGTLGFFINKAKKKEAITLFGKGEPRRTFTHVWDICAQLYELSVSKEAENEVVNIVGEEFSLLDVATMFSKYHDTEIKFVDWPDMAQKLESGDTIFDAVKNSQLIDHKNTYQMNNWVNQLKL